MKKLLFLAFIMLSVVACTDNYLITGDEDGVIENPEAITNKGQDTKLPDGTNEGMAKNGDECDNGGDEDGDGSGDGTTGSDTDDRGGYDDQGGTTDLCVGLCNFAYEDCYETAVRMRDQDFYACEQIRITGTEIVDVMCTRRIIVGYEIVITPEGEEIERPIFEIEEYVCGQEEVITYSTDEAVLEEYRQCRIDAIEYFLAEVEKCDFKQASCLKKCKKGPAGPL